MLNETRRAHIKRQVIAQIGMKTAESVVDFEIARRVDTAEKLERQTQKEHEEISFLKSLDLSELSKEAGV